MLMEDSVTMPEIYGDIIIQYINKMQEYMH